MLDHLLRANRQLLTRACVCSRLLGCGLECSSSSSSAAVKVHTAAAAACHRTVPLTHTPPPPFICRVFDAACGSSWKVMRTRVNIIIVIVIGTTGIVVYTCSSSSITPPPPPPPAGFCVEERENDS